MIPRIASALSQMTVSSVAFPSSSASLGIDALDERIRASLRAAGDDLYTWVLLSAFIVAIGVALEGPEIVYELWPRAFRCFLLLTEERKHNFERRIKLIGWVGWIMVALGVFGEGVFEGLQNRTEGQVQTFNDILLNEARLTANSARHSAVVASEAASSAVRDATKAKAEADTFESRIRFANQNAAGAIQQAADAESHLADALQRAADAEEQLNRLKSPRTVTNVQELISSLAPFRGTRFSLKVFGDPESIHLAQAIDKTLSAAGWIRNQNFPDTPPSIAFNIFDSKDGGVAPICVEKGIGVAIGLRGSIESIETNSASYLFKPSQAGQLLARELGQHIEPANTQNVITPMYVDNRSVVVGRIDICIGQKP